MAAYMEHGHAFKVIEIPFSPFQNEFGDDDDDDDDDKERRFEYVAALRRSSVGYGSRRQEFLRSYTFCRPASAAKPLTVQERVRSRFKSLWVGAVACNPYNLPRRVRRLRDKLALKSAHHSLQRSSRNHTAGSRSVPFLQQCFRA